MTLGSRHRQAGARHFQPAGGRMPARACSRTRACAWRSRATT